MERYLAVAFLVGVGACSRTQPAPAPQHVELYCSVDESYARPVLDQFEADTNIKVDVVFDSEAGKTTGLVNRLLAETRSGKPGADVFWSGELFGTMRLAEMGVLERYDPPSAIEIPVQFRDTINHWTALAVRARVVAYDPSRTPADKVPDRWEDLAAPDTASQVAIANPLFGTTRGHVAAMFALWGRDRARHFLKGLRDGEALIVDGNSMAVRAVMDGRAQFGVTDSDDVLAARHSGAKLESKLLDMGDGGVLLIPCSVALVKGGANLEAAKKLVDFLVSARAERMLAQSGSGNIPVRESLRRELGMDWPIETKLHFVKIMQAMEQSDDAVRDILIHGS